MRMVAMTLRSNPVLQFCCNHLQQHNFSLPCH
jgi:hypothetical protein